MSLPSVGSPSLARPAPRRWLDLQGPRAKRKAILELAADVVHGPHHDHGAHVAPESVDREARRGPLRQRDHGDVDHEVEEAESHDDQRQRDDREHRLDERVGDAENRGADQVGAPPMDRHPIPERVRDPESGGVDRPREREPDRIRHVDSVRDRRPHILADRCHSAPRQGASLRSSRRHEADLLRDARGVPRLARGASRGRARAPRRLPQEGDGQALYDLARVGRRGALLRLDVRRSLGDESYTIRFTPRKPRSTWSAVNIRRARELIAEGRMRPAGLAAFEARTDDRSAIYAYEQRHAAKLEPDEERELRANAPAWRYFQSRPPSYRKTAIWWVVSAKRDETRRKRLRTLIDDSAAGRTLRQLTPPAKRV